MKVLKYRLMTEVNRGTEEQPDIACTFSDVSLICTDENYEANLSFAKAEAYNGEVSVENIFKTVEEAKSAKIAEIKQVCESYIYAGTDVTYADNITEHFTYTLADQSNISEMFTAIMAGATEFPYHADGEICKVYSKAQIVAIYGTLSLFKANITTYHNSLKAQVNAMTDADEINAVKFGETELTGDYLDNYNTMMTSAETQLNAVLARIPSDEATA